MGISGEVKWGDNVISENSIWEVDRRTGKYRSGNDGAVPTKQAMRQHRRCRLGGQSGD